MGKRSKTQNHFKRPGHFVQVHRDWFSSPAYRSLSRNARCLLHEIHMCYVGSNNGRIVFSVSMAEQALGCVEDTARKAFDELIDRKFIERSQDCDYTNGKAREWYLTFLPRRNGQEPTDCWKYWSEKTETASPEIGLTPSKIREEN